MALAAHVHRDNQIVILLDLPGIIIFALFFFLILEI